MTDPAIRNMVFSSIRQHLGRDAENPGAVLYNGWDTLRSNKGLYIMGFNPGGAPNDSKTMIDYLNELKDNHCSYEDECWYCSADCRNDKHFGKKPHQKKVKELARVLGYDVRQSFAANAVFFRSRKQGDLKTPWDIFEKCWPIHQEFLSIVQPRIILCLGNGDDYSAFAYLKMKIAPSEKHYGRVKEFMGEISVADGRTIRSRVIGVRHPSYPWFDPVKDLKLHLQQNQGMQAGYGC